MVNVHVLQFVISQGNELYPADDVDFKEAVSDKPEMSWAEYLQRENS